MPDIKFAIDGVSRTAAAFRGRRTLVTEDLNADGVDRVATAVLARLTDKPPRAAIHAPVVY